MPSFAEGVLTAALYLGVIGTLVRICWTDFFYLKIWNRDLTLLLGLTVTLLLVTWPGDLPLRLGLGAILFALSFVFWLLGKLGAGDVKLFGIVGFLISPQHAMLLLVLIMAFVLVFVVLYRNAQNLRFVPQLAGRRVLELVETGRIPYGVPIALATIALILPTVLIGR